MFTLILILMFAVPTMAQESGISGRIFDEFGNISLAQKVKIATSNSQATHLDSYMLLAQPTFCARRYL